MPSVIILIIHIHCRLISFKLFLSAFFPSRQALWFVEGALQRRTKTSKYPVYSRRTTKHPSQSTHSQPTGNTVVIPCALGQSYMVGGSTVHRLYTLRLLGSAFTRQNMDGSYFRIVWTEVRCKYSTYVRTCHAVCTNCRSM